MLAHVGTCCTRFYILAAIAGRVPVWTTTDQNERARFSRKTMHFFESLTCQPPLRSNATGSLHENAQLPLHVSLIDK